MESSTPVLDRVRATFFQLWEPEPCCRNALKPTDLIAKLDTFFIHSNSPLSVDSNVGQTTSIRTHERSTKKISNLLVHKHFRSTLLSNTYLNEACNKLKERCHTLHFEVMTERSDAESAADAGSFRFFLL